MTTVAPVRDEESAIWGALAVTQDVSNERRAQRELREQTERLEQRAKFDDLTGLFTRAYFRDRLEHAIARAARDGQVLAVMFVDIDHFKTVNDTLGHEAGDLLLRTVAVRLKEAVRESDTVGRLETVGRLAGDEFTVLLEGIDREVDVATVAERISAALRDPMAVEGSEPKVTASIGIALGPVTGDTGSSLLAAADTAMYRAKAQGGNTHRFFSPDMERKVAERRRLHLALHEAVKQTQFELHYQPTLDLANDQVISVEALVRWMHPERGLILPAEFIHAAEASGLMSSLTEWVMSTACRQAVEWRRQGLPDFRIAVNASSRQLQGDLDELVARVLAETGLPSADLELEVTERFLGEDDPAAEAMLGKLEALGVRIAIDDFGTGSSSLSRLRTLPANVLKIDRTFVQEVDDAGAIAPSIVALGHNLGMQVVGEGVETPGQRVGLADAGCDAAAGYLFAPPLKADELARWVLGSRDGPVTAGR